MSLNFFCIQPIKLEEETFLQIHGKRFIPNPKEWIDITNKNDLNKLDNNTINHEWFYTLTALERNKLYAYNTNFSQFNNQLTSISSLSSFIINNSESGFILFYDYDCKVFFILISLSVELSSDIDSSIFFSLYNKVRNDLVIDTANKNISISSWAKSIHEFSIKILENEFNKSNCSEILENSGYISSIFNNFNSLTIPSNFKDAFLSSNHNIDLLDEKKYECSNLSINKERYKKLCNNYTDDENELFLESSAIIFFGWRFSTLFGFENQDSFKILPLLINIQNVYFQIDNHYKAYLGSLYEDVRYSNDYLKLSETLKLSDKLTVSFQNLVFEKENFVSELKPFQFEVYSVIEKYWSLDKDYDKIEKTFLICQTSLERKLQIKNNNIQQKQSDILFILTIIQIIAIVGVLGDYFSFFSIDVKEEHSELYTLLKKYITYILFGSATGLIIFAYFEKFGYTIRRLFRK